MTVDYYFHLTEKDRETLKKMSNSLESNVRTVIRYHKGSVQDALHLIVEEYYDRDWYDSFDESVYESFWDDQCVRYDGLGNEWTSNLLLEAYSHYEKKYYRAILIAPDGEWVTDFKGETVEEVDSKLANSGSRWVFFPMALIVEDRYHDKKYFSIDDDLEIIKSYHPYDLLGKEGLTVKEFIGFVKRMYG